MMITMASLDAQLHAVQAGWWHDCPEDVKNGLLAYRHVIDQLRKGVETRRWPEDVLPCSSLALAGAPDLLAIRPEEAAHSVVKAWEEKGRVPLGPQDCHAINSIASNNAKKRNFKRKLVSGKQPGARNGQENG